jgi:hypothetical protein
MRRTSTAAFFALPLLLAIPAISAANPPQQCYGPFGRGGVCLGMFSKIHQHGPLFNYGPYYGYPPFEPYGPWNSYLHYNPWYYGDGTGGGFGGGGFGFGGGGGFGLGHGGLLGRLHCHGCGGRGCSSCDETGWHGSYRQGGWFHGHKCWSCCHKNKCAAAPVEAGCTSCKPVAFDPERTDPTSRFRGTTSVIQTAAFYPELPTLLPSK